MSDVSRGNPPEQPLTPRARLERFLHASPDRYRDFFDNAIDPIFITDSHMNYVDVNPRAVEAFGYSREEWLTMSIRDVIPPEQLERSEDEVAKLAETAIAFPPMQPGASFNLEALKKKIAEKRNAMGK